MRFRIVILACVVSFFNCEGQSKKPATKPTRPSSEIQEPTPQSKAAEAADKYMRGLKLADLPEGRQMLQEVQWVTGPADNGSNFYLLVAFPDKKTGTWKIAYFGDTVDIDREVAGSYHD